MPENETIEMFDTVATPDGDATVVGFLEASGQVEVRYPGRNLLIWPLNRVKKVNPATDAVVVSAPASDLGSQAPSSTPADAYRQAREAGITPNVDPTAFGDEMAGIPQAPPKQSTLAKMVESGETTKPKMTKQEALAKARAARAAKRRGEE